ncbi:MAG: sigma-54 dependent transcriptional regulator [Ignavibacteriaceae bacterium]|jgi:DNA-binding NtrC family response regulator|nr:sigma-54 dependent transcriptional regulator [Ignavibacteriaceae bacterium]
MTIEQLQKKFGIVGKSKEIHDLIDIIIQVAASDISVLIFGESGVGKEVFARAIHSASHRAENPLISVNCGAIPEGILESELFGHNKGSFTGAIDARKGYFELANSGTLFLDEIAEMPITTQVKLLRAIETKEFMRIGAETLTKVDVRFLAATNKDLQNEVDAKRFREDLFFRLKAVTIHIPPLRKRKADIFELVHFFADKFAEENRTAKPVFTTEALDYLHDYPWPGNVRELKNAVETSIALTKNAKLTKEIFEQIIPYPKSGTSMNFPVVTRKTPEEVEREFIYRALFELKKDILDIKEILLQKENLEIQDNPNDVHSVEEAGKRAIILALKKSKGNKRIAAEMLGISERTLYRKIKEYHL